MKEEIRHPAKYSDEFIPEFCEVLKSYNCKSVLDPFAGTGKIGKIKEYGYDGQIYANEIEKEWLSQSKYDIDYMFFEDAQFCDFGGVIFDAICTSPTYGNRMADHHNAKDSSKRNTYTHCIGHDLKDGNTGKMQFGREYKQKHEMIYKNIVNHLKPGGVFILNISNHIRKGEEVDVCSWHIETLKFLGLHVEKDIKVQTHRLGYGSNSSARVKFEHIYVLIKY